MGSDLLCLGLTTLDVVARPIDVLPEEEHTLLVSGVRLAPAGTAGGAALVAAALGLNVALVSALGDDLAGRCVRLALEEAGVDTTLTPTLIAKTTSTTVLAVRSDGGRPNFHAVGAGGLAAVSTEVVKAARTARYLHYAGVGGRDLDGGPGAELLREAKAAGVVITCDLISPRKTAMSEMTRLLPYVDYFMPSAAEARLLTGLDDLEAASAAFRALGAKACIIKNGGQGAIAFLEGRSVHLPAYAITPIDTTSCGDSYCAGFIAALARGWLPLDACRFAMATAALVAQDLGTLGALQSFEATAGAMDVMTPVTAAP